MKLFESRPVLATIFFVGSTGCLGVLLVTYLSLLRHLGFPWMIWMGGVYWFWGTWFAGSRLLKS